MQEIMVLVLTLNALFVDFILTYINIYFFMTHRHIYV